MCIILNKKKILILFSLLVLQLLCIQLLIIMWQCTSNVLILVFTTSHILLFSPLEMSAGGLYVEGQHKIPIATCQ